MKPKQRDTQAQSSRMWLRHHDHREAILDKMYHYSMYVRKSAKRDKQGHIIEEAINDYVWIKTPHHYFLLYGTTYMYREDRKTAVREDVIKTVGWMDIDREFQSIWPIVGQTTAYSKWTPMFTLYPRANNNFLKTPNVFMIIGNRVFMVLSEGSPMRVGGTQAVYTDDGVIYKILNFKNPLGSPISIRTGYKRPFGNNGWLVGDYFVGSNVYEEGYRNLNGLVLYDEQEGTGYTISISLPDIQRATYTYLCPTQTGCIIRCTLRTAIHVEGHPSEDIIDYVYYHVTTDGNYRVVNTTENVFGAVTGCTDNNTYNNFGTLSYICHGNTSGFLHYIMTTQYDENTGQERRTWWFTANMTTNNGVDWKSHTLLTVSILGGTYYIPEVKGYIWFAQGKYYAMISTSDSSYSYHSYSVKMFWSYTGDAWNEIILPKWLDVPVITENAGLGIVDSYSSDKLRIAIDPSETSDADCLMHNMYGNDIIRFTDGQLDFTNELFGVYLTDGLHNAYFDNEHLAENSKSFAWITQGTSVCDDFGTYADHVQRYDYCAPAGGFDGDTPDPDLEYVYYIWDDVNNKFVGVDRHLSTYEHYPIIYVEVLPPTGVVMTLYGVRTDINQNPVYDYFIYENDEFVQIKNIESYPRYTVVTVSQLPMTGQANIIYAVARDMNSFSTYMYIWNPDAVWYDEDDQGHIIEHHGAFEDINTTEYPMTGKSFITVNVKKLPNTGKEGIIYVSETKITETVATDVETKYNYYRWLKNEGRYELITPVMSHNNIYVMTIHNLEPPTTTIDTDLITFRILKTEDTGMGKTMYSSEEDVIKYLQRRTDKWDQWLTSKDDLPFVGSSGIFYIIKDEPVLNTGSYTLYIWDDLNLKYKESDKYEYYIPQSGQPEPAGLMKLVMDVGTAVITNEGEE